MYIPMLFNTQMMQAILNGHKTITRRIVKPQPTILEKKSMWRYCPNWLFVWPLHQEQVLIDEGFPLSKQIPYKIGDIIWARETWAEWSGGYAYKAYNPYGYSYPNSYVDKWKPSIHMPKQAARVFLKIKNVRMERIQAITPEDCEAEGVNHISIVGPELIKKQYSALWDSTIDKKHRDIYGWEANPWVWVIEFEPCDVPERWYENA